MLMLPEVKKYTTLSKTTIYRLMQEGKFPRPVRVSVRRVAWEEAEIQAYLTSISIAK